MSAGSVAALAGCIGDGDDDDTQSGDGLFGADDSDNAFGDGSNDQPSGDDSDDSPSGDDATDDESGTASDDAEASADEDDEPADDGSEETDEGEPASDEVIFADVFQWEESFEIRIEVEDPATTITQRVYGDDYFTAMSGDMVPDMETYFVDGTAYEIVGGQCTVRDRPQNEFEVFETEPPDDDDIDEIVSDGTTTVDDEEVYVFPDGSETLYVSTVTGYLVRVEFDDGHADFHSWGEVGPIRPPEMDCREGA